MASLILQVFLDSVMALLLIITVVYCGRLNMRIKVLQDSKSELARIIKEFDTSTQRATQSIAEIHEATARIAENMQHKIDKANYVADDLQYMIEKGNKLAGRSDAGEIDRNAANRKSPADAVRRSGVRSGAAVGEEDAASARSSGMDSMLKKVRSMGASEALDGEILDNEAGLSPRRQGARLRSKAEQELFEALKAGGGKG